MLKANSRGKHATWPVDLTEVFSDFLAPKVKELLSSEVSVNVYHSRRRNVPEDLSVLYKIVIFLGAFAKYQKTTSIFVLSVSLSVCSHGMVIFEYFSKIHLENSSFIQI